ncbi:hypothetical protein WJX79_004414 [Trebouxia sp. C0005]
MLFKAPCDTCSITGAPGWHRSGDMNVCRWCYPRLPVITPGMTLSMVQSNMLSPSVLPELTRRRKAWEQAHSLAAQRSVWSAEQSEEAARSQASPRAVNTAEASTAPSIAAAETAACDLFTVNCPLSLISSSSLDDDPAEEPATGHLQTPSIVHNRCKHYERAGMSSVSADESDSRLLDQETSHIQDKGKKSAAFVTDKHINEAPCPSPSDKFHHPKQLGDQQENGDGTGGVKKLTRKRSRKQSAVDVHQKGSQRQRRKSASSKNPKQSPLQTPELAGVPKPQRYRDINALILELQLADTLPRESHEVGHAVGGPPQERASAEEGPTRLLNVRTQIRQQDKLERLAAAEWIWRLSLH